MKHLEDEGKTWKVIGRRLLFSGIPAGQWDSSIQPGALYLVVNVYHNLVTVAEFPGLKWNPSQNGSIEKVMLLFFAPSVC